VDNWHFLAANAYNAEIDTFIDHSISDKAVPANLSPVYHTYDVVK